MLLLSAASLHAQSPDWFELQQPNGPTARFGHALARDAERGVMLFGGQDAGGLRNDTWQLRGGGWQQGPFVSGPPPRRDHALAHDPKFDRVVLFGGRDGSTLLSDTWVWNGTFWQQISTPTTPPARADHALAWHAPTQSILCFGGRGVGQVDLDDTWAFDGTTWTQLTPTASPLARSGHAMAYDTSRGRVVLFGGESPGLGLVGDTWSFDGVTWLPLVTPITPAPRREHGLVYDATLQRLLMFGGDLGGARTDESWLLDGDVWTLVTGPGPDARAGHAVGFDRAGGRVVMFGGQDGALLDDTWLTNPDAVTYGAGCGSPALSLLPDLAAPAAVGGVAEAIIPSPPTPLVAGALGFDDTFFGVFPLPLPLVGLGMPGCELLHSADVLGVATSPGGSAARRLAVTIPNLPQLVGQHLYAQAYAYAPGQNPLGVIVSNGLDWTIVYGAGSPQAVTEDFNDALQLDRPSSSGDWALGFATFGVIGGDGRHGAFRLSFATDTGEFVDGRRVYVVDCDQTVVPASQSRTGEAYTITDGRFYFTSMVVPADVHLRFVGSVPPVVNVVGTIDVRGDVEVDGGSVTVAQPSTSFAGQAGASGGPAGGRGGDGAERCLGVGPGNGQFDGRDGEAVQVLANHAYAGSAGATAGRGSSLYPASGLNSAQQFGVNPVPSVQLYYSLSAAAGGGGGGHYAPGGDGRVIGVFSGTTLLPNWQTFAGPNAPGGAAMTLFPFPPGGGLQRSSEHFLVGGAGGGGSGSNCTLSLSLARTWASGAGGGGGGGAIALRAGHRLHLDGAGRLFARGGDAYDYSGLGASAQVAPAGGGSGGSIVLQSGGLASLLGAIDVTGGDGGTFDRQGGTGIGPQSGVVQIRGGDGGAGFVRFETPTAPSPIALGGMVPAAGPDNVGALTEVDALAATQSLFYVVAAPRTPRFVGYEIHAVVDGAAVVYSDDPSISPLQATTGAAVRARFQAGLVDPQTGAASYAGPWRETVRTVGGQAGIAADELNAYRFQLVFDRALATTVQIDRVVVHYLD